METLRSDGKAVDVVYSGSNAGVTGDIAKGDIVVAEGFFGVAMNNAASGETVALEIAAREHEIKVGSGIAAAKGDVLYIDANGVVTTSNSDKPFLKVTKAKNSSDYVWGIILPQV